MEKLSNNLKELRKNASLTQADLAAAIGVSRKTINTIENRVFVPSTILALKLAIVLHCSVHEIFELESD